jgi:putative heme transporter
VAPRPGSLAAPGATAWRLLGIGALVVAAWWLARQLMPVLVPLVVALLLAALLAPLAQRMRARGMHPTVSSAAAVGALLALMGLVAVLIVPPFVERVGELGRNVEEGLRKVAYSVAEDIGGADRSAVDNAIDDTLKSLGDSRGDIAGGVLAGATALAQALGSLVLVLFLCFFLVKDGPQIGRWIVGLVPGDRRPEVEDVGGRAWSVLGTYARGIVFVATLDAVLIGLALVIVGVPLVLPLAVLTWFAAFFPIVGAIAAGAAAVLVALVAEGVGAAIAIAVAILAVQQLEGNVLYPAVVGPRVHLHPVAVLLAVTVGATIGGIPGAFLAVPVATVAAVVIDHWRERREPAQGLIAT